MEKLENKNYYLNNYYMSASQFKDFKKCEAYALAKMRGEWQDKTSNAFLVGGYIDAYFSGELDQFKANNTELFNKDGSLKATYKQCETIIKRIEQDEYMMHLLSGEKQLIQTGIIEGVPFKIKMDSVLDDTIVDQKIMKDCKDVWNNGYEPFWKVYGYDIQMAIYQYIHAQNTGIKKPCKLAVATKEDECDLRVFKFKQETIDNALSEVKALAPHYQDVKNGLVPPVYCGECAYCKSLKKLSKESEEEI